MNINQDTIATKALHESGGTLAKIFLRSSPDPISITTLEEGRFFEVSDSFTRLIGFDREEIIGRTAIDIGFWLKPEDRQQVVEILRNDNMVREHEIRFRSKTNQVHIGLLSAEIIDISGTTFMIGVVHDITDRKEAEEAARDSEQFSSLLLGHSPNPILVTNVDGSIAYVNPAFEILTGFSSENVIGLRYPYPWWITRDNKKVTYQLRKNLRSGATKYEALFQKLNGERFSVEVSLVPVGRKGAIRYNLETWIDTTEQKRLADDRQLYIGVATKAQEEERKHIARELHDDTVQALASLNHQVHTMMGKHIGPPEVTIEELKAIEYKINNILEGVRRFSHSLRPAPLDALGLVPALESLIVDLRTEAKLECHIDVIGTERRLPSDVELALFRIAQESLRNAEKHSNATRAIIKMAFYNQKVKLTVTDNGIGFELHEKLSDFAQHGRVGLLGMKERASLIGGTLSLKSRKGKGTTVVVEVLQV